MDVWLAFLKVGTWLGTGAAVGLGMAALIYRSKVTKRRTWIGTTLGAGGILAGMIFLGWTVPHFHTTFYLDGVDMSSPWEKLLNRISSHRGVFYLSLACLFSFFGLRVGRACSLRADL
jgi:hypothetical protein